VREQSAQRLLEIGGEALPALEQATRSADREIRFRAQRLTTLVRKYDFQRRLETFASHASSMSDDQLPGWARVRALVGDSDTTRSLYVEMVRAETPLFQTLHEHPQQASRVVEARINQLRQEQVLSNEPLPFAPIAALTFMCTQRDIELAEDSIEALLGLCNQGGFHKAITESAYRDPLRLLLGRVIEQASMWSALYAIPLAMQYEIKEGITPAIRILSVPADETLPHVELRRWAVLAIAKFGDRSHTELLEKWLTDETPCVSPTIAIHRGYETQLRDIALAALWKLHDEDPQRHGFGDQLQADPQVVFHAATVGFENEAQRQRALAQWREFRGKTNEPRRQ
jgi:hypothetical protein